MICLITNETCFAVKSVHIRRLRCANHDRNMFILSMIEKTSRGSFTRDQTKHVTNGRHVESRRMPKRSKIYYETKCLVKIWADIAIQRQLLATGWKQNIYENIATKRNDRGCKHNAKPPSESRNIPGRLIILLYEPGICSVVWTTRPNTRLTFTSIYLQGRHPVPIDDFERHVDRMHMDGDHGFSEEYLVTISF